MGQSRSYLGNSHLDRMAHAKPWVETCPVSLRNSIEGNAQGKHGGDSRRWSGEGSRGQVTRGLSHHSKDSASILDEMGASRGFEQRTKMIQLPFNRIALIEGVRTETGDTAFRPKQEGSLSCTHCLRKSCKKTDRQHVNYDDTQGPLLEIGLTSATAQPAV